ncbi:MAG: acetylornithine/succinylornithine family transaminase [Planctomycetota bacterium]
MTPSNTTTKPERGLTAALAPTYRRPETLFVAGRGAWLEDDQGQRFLDMTSGIAVNALGHGASEIAEVLREGADGLIHVSNLYHTLPAIELAEALVARSFATQVFFANSGSEANEGAIKFARLAAGDDRREVVHFGGSFHGRTFASLAATDRPDYKQPFEPLPPGFRRAEWNDASALEAIDRRTALVMLEPIQGEAGIRVPSTEWVRAVRARCDEVGALLLFDEVQCGLGRTGKLFAYQGLGVEPDLLTLAKPLAGGLPMGAILLGEKLANTVRPGCHGTTFGGGPLVAKVALRVLTTIDRPAFLAAVDERGQHFQAALGELAGVTEVRGRGLMIGAVVPNVADVVAAAFDERLLVVPAGKEVVRFLPPLNVTEEEIDEAATRFQRALARTATTTR